MVEAAAAYHKDQGKSLQLGAAVRTMPAARRARRPTTRKSTAAAAKEEKEPRDEKEKDPRDAKTTSPPDLNRWQTLVLRIQERRRWATRGHLLNYAKSGCPKKVDGKARGFGSHLGRWQRREIAYEW